MRRGSTGILSTYIQAVFNASCGNRSTPAGPPQHARCPRHSAPPRKQETRTHFDHGISGSFPPAHMHRRWGVFAAPVQGRSSYALKHRGVYSLYQTHILSRRKRCVSENSGNNINFCVANLTQFPSSSLLLSLPTRHTLPPPTDTLRGPSTSSSTYPASHTDTQLVPLPPSIITPTHTAGFSFPRRPRAHPKPNRHKCPFRRRG